MDDDILTNFLGHKSTSKAESLDPVKVRLSD